MISKIPYSLQIGDGVALVNPAGMLPERFKNQYGYVKAHLKELGFSVKDLVIQDDRENAQRRSEMLMTAFSDPQIKAILPLCGGARIYDILPLLDYDVLANNPKIICGSSELSALMVLIAEKAEMVTFFGPHLNFLNPKASKPENWFTLRSFWNMLQWDWHGRNGLNRNEAYHFFAVPRVPTFPLKIRNIYRDPARITDYRYRDNFYCASNTERNVTGKLLVGSLATLVKLCEDRLAPNVAGKIVVLDSLDMSLETVAKLFQSFSAHCNLSCAEAVVFSSLAERTDRSMFLYPELRDPDQIKDFLQKVSGLLGGEISVFHGFPIGHCAYKLTLPIGITASIIAETGDLLLEESPYKQ
jgi:muramoyltetrapeptide carboxypeptidase LdcA involved in peptidoglycan recycling